MGERTGGSSEDYHRRKRRWRDTHLEAIAGRRVVFRAGVFAVRIAGHNPKACV